MSGNSKNRAALGGRRSRGQRKTMAPAEHSSTMPKHRRVVTTGLINSSTIVRERQCNKSHPRSSKEIQTTVQDQQGSRLKA